MTFNDNQFQDIWLTDIASVQLYRLNAGNTASWSATEESALADFIIQASSDILGELGRLPLPYVDTLLIDYSTEYLINTRLMVLSQTPLLEVTTLTNGDATTIASTKYTLQPNNSYPKRYIQLLKSGVIDFKPKTSGQVEQAISLVGVFGLVPHYGNCWTDTGQDVQDDPLSDSATSLTLSDATGFSQGQYLQLESETVFVDAVDTDTNILTIERGVLGTTAVAHVQNIDVKRYKHISAIQKACNEWASYLWSRKDNVGEQIEVYENGVTIAQGLSPRIYRTLQRYADYGAVSAS